MSYLEARNRAITEAMTSDPRTIMVGDFGGPGTPEGGYAKAFGAQRVRQVPISEEGFGGIAVGAYELMRAAIASDDPVVYIDSGAVYDEVEDVPVGNAPSRVRARVVRPGTDVTLVAISGAVGKALRVAERLASEGISVEVVDPQ